MFLYNLGLVFYVGLVRLVSPFHSKARKWVRGRKGLWQKLTDALRGNEKPVVWFHVSSLGEFEQARPVIEGLRVREGNSFFCCSLFFRLQGMKLRKNIRKLTISRTCLPTCLPKPNAGSI